MRKILSRMGEGEKRSGGGDGGDQRSKILYRDGEKRDKNALGKGELESGEGAKGAKDAEDARDLPA